MAGSPVITVGTVTGGDPAVYKHNCVTICMVVYLYVYI